MRCLCHFCKKLSEVKAFCGFLSEIFIEKFVYPVSFFVYLLVHLNP